MPKAVNRFDTASPRPRFGRHDWLLDMTTSRVLDLNQDAIQRQRETFFLSSKDQVAS